MMPVLLRILNFLVMNHLIWNDDCIVVYALGNIFVMFAIYELPKHFTPLLLHAILLIYLSIIIINWQPESKNFPVTILDEQEREVGKGDLLVTKENMELTQQGLLIDLGLNHGIFFYFIFRGWVCFLHV